MSQIKFAAKVRQLVSYNMGDAVEKFGVGIKDDAVVLNDGDTWTGSGGAFLLHGGQVYNLRQVIEAGLAAGVKPLPDPVEYKPVFGNEHNN